MTGLSSDLELKEPDGGSFFHLYLSDLGVCRPVLRPFDKSFQRFLRPFYLGVYRAVRVVAYKTGQIQFEGLGMARSPVPNALDPARDVKFIVFIFQIR